MTGERLSRPGWVGDLCFALRCILGVRGCRRWGCEWLGEGEWASCPFCRRMKIQVEPV
jgi:hypothetical protein